MTEKQTPKALNFIPRGYQVDFLSAPQNFKIAVWHRKAGKSMTALCDQIEKALLFPNIYYYFLPTYSLAKRVIWDKLIKDHLPMQYVERINSSELAVYYKNGSIQRFCGCEDPDLHRGINPFHVVFDEYSEMPEEIWTAIVKPVLVLNGGLATFIYTPKGKNHSWKLLQMAKENPKSWFHSLKTVSDTDVVGDEEINEARMTMPEALVQQEFFCAFTENAGAVFHRVRSCLYDAREEAKAGHIYRLGIDLAKYNDWTVITPFDMSTFEVLPQIRFNQVDWMMQEAKITAMAYKYGNAQLMIDRTGVGDSVVDRLENGGLNIGEEGRIVFSEKSKRDMLNNLITLIENGKIKIPNDEGLITELESMQYHLSDNGKVKMAVPKNMTDDRIMSLAMAVYGISKPLGIMRRESVMVENNINNNNDGLYAGI